MCPGTCIAIIEEASHLTMIEQPERYTQIIRDFLRSVDQSASEEGEASR